MRQRQGLRSSAAAVPPLTCSDITGKLYTRREDVENEIRAALQMPPSEWPARATAHGGWSDEACVHLIRRLRNAGESSLLGALLHTLMKHASETVEEFAQGFGDADFEIIEGTVRDEIVDRILATEATNKSEILEVSFGTTVRNLTLNEVAKRNRRRKINSPMPIIQSEEGDVTDLAALLVDDSPDPLAQLIQARDHNPTFRELLGAVTDRRHRLAFILHELRGWPYHPGSPPRPCLCSKFNISERQIRTWIGKAREQMRKALGDRS